ncbi:MAG: amidase [Betaproteobacteria bacterium]|nr:amidase [Betaproteobacteria bacterium]
MSDPTMLSAAAAAAAIRERRLGCEELTLACLDRIARLEPTVRAFVDLQPEAALRRARELDRTKPQGDQALRGIPVAVKEVFDVAGYRCAWGTAVHAGRIPERDAEAVARLKAAGVVILGTAVSTEYAIAAAGPTTNPHDPSRSPGGSSSGPAAAVAAYMVPLALGSQSIGSIIRPSVYCGVMGLKPTRGAISNRGAMPLAIELDQAGPIARTPEDLLLACRALFAPDPRDAASRAVPVPEPSSPAQEIVEMVGPLRERVQPASREAVERALLACRKAKLQVRRVELPSEFDRIDDVVWTLICRGVAAQHGDDYDRAANLMSPRMRELVERGRGTTDGQHRLAVEFAAGFAAFLTRLLPPGSVAVQAAVDDVAPLRADGTGSPLLQGLWTAAGFPVLAMPCGTVGGLPVGVQLAAAPMQESTLLAVAATLLRHL